MYHSVQRALLSVLGAPLLAACGNPAPVMTPDQLCEKQVPLAEAWRVSDGQDASSPEKAAMGLNACVKRWTAEAAADPARYAKTAACAAPTTTYEALEQCVVDNLPTE